MKMVWYGSCINKLVENGDTKIQGFSICAVAATKDEAIGILYKEAHKYFPEYEHCALNMFLIDNKAVLKVAADHLTSIGGA